MRKTHFIILSAFILASACKTQEQIAREKLVDDLAVQMVQKQKTDANTLEKIQDLEEKLLLVGGKVEDTTYSQRQNFLQQNQALQERISVIEESNNILAETVGKQSKELSSIRRQLKDQKAFLDKVLKNIKSISSRSSSTKKKSNKKLSLYDDAMKDFRKGLYNKVKPKLLRLLDDKKIKGNKRARVIHNLGMVNYSHKKNDVAIVYFSRLYTEHPKSPYIPNGLLFLGKTFRRDKKTDQAKQTLQQLISKYPKARQVKEAKAILKKL